MACGIIPLGFLLVGCLVVRGARASRRAGIDPYTPDSVLIAQALQAQGPRPLEDRLAELDDLHRRGVISSDEHRAARTRALAGD